MDPNGAGEYAALRARVGAVEAAVTTLARRVEERVIRRLAEHGADLEELRNRLEVQEQRTRQLGRELADYREALRLAREESRHGDP